MGLLVTIDISNQFSYSPYDLGNAVILKGGKEASHTNASIFETIQLALKSAPSHLSIPINSVQLVSTREEISSLLKEDAYIDLVIPRGSKELVRHIQSSTRIPVLGHADGICSVYIDEHADIEMASKVVLDAKTDYPAACNAAETLLIHKKILQTSLPSIARTLLNAGVLLHADPISYDVLSSNAQTAEFVVKGKVVPSKPQDYSSEFLGLEMAIRTVESLGEAINHINHHGSKHTEAIITKDQKTAEEFMSKVDAAGVFWNASTRFADGFRFGFGAEIGVSRGAAKKRLFHVFISIIIFSFIYLFLIFF